jgi:hypothetical protein
VGLPYDTEWRRTISSFSVASIGKSVVCGTAASPECTSWLRVSTTRPQLSAACPGALNLTPSYCFPNEERRVGRTRASPADRPTRLTDEGAAWMEADHILRNVILLSYPSAKRKKCDRTSLSPQHQISLNLRILLKEFKANVKDISLHHNVHSGSGSH